MSGSGSSASGVDWEQRWSSEARRKHLPMLQSIVSKFSRTPGLISMHGGFPPAESFPFTSFRSCIVDTSDAAAAAAPAAAAAAPAAAAAAAAPAAAAPAAAPAAAAKAAAKAAAGSAPPQQQERQQQALEQQELASQLLDISDPQLVAAAQQYCMQPLGYPPLQGWAKQLVLKLHRPATLQPGASSSAVGYEVSVTPGASAALDALVRILVDRGDPVLLEQYSYSHHIDAHLLPMGCELLPIPMDELGLLPDHLDQLLQERQAAGKPMPRVLYTIPTGQNPTGATMTPQRMQQVYDLARKWDLVVIEDDAYYWLQYPAGPDTVPGLGLKPGFLSIDTDGRVVRVDTLAKLLGPGFRLGWLSGPPPLVDKVALYLAASSVGACSLSQVMVHRLLVAWGEPGFDRFVRHLQRGYARAALNATAAAQQHLAGLADWQPVTAGMFMWLRLADGSDSSFLLEAGAAEGVVVVPGYLASAEHLQLLEAQREQQQRQPGQQGQQQQQQGQQPQHQLPPCPYFRVSFASTTSHALQEGFAALRRAIVRHREQLQL